MLRLYDLDSRYDPKTAWSFNAWKTRLVLNYKQIPYDTVWVDHDTLAPTLKALSVPENSPPDFPYTVPTVQLADGEIIMGSSKIARKFDEMHPLPSLDLNAALEAETDTLIHEIAFPLFAIYMPAVARNVLVPSTVPTFEASRAARFGMSLTELERSKGGDVAWENAKPGLDKLAVLLTGQKKDEGPFIQGDRVCYADFLLVAMFETLKRVDRDLFNKVVAYDKSFSTLYEASAEWRERDY